MAYDKNWYLLEEFHRLCKHSVGRHRNLWIFFHGNAALNKVHGCIQIVESFTELICLQSEIKQFDYE